jgi:hypothetical protein
VAPSSTPLPSPALSTPLSDEDVAALLGKKPRWGVRLVVAALALTVVAGGAYKVATRRKAAPVVAVPVAPPIGRLDKLALPVKFPPGWAPMPGSGHTHSAPGGRVKTALLYRGGTTAFPEREAFVSVLPLAGDLAQGKTMTDAELLTATRNGDVGLKLQLFDSRTTYTAQGCEVARFGTQRAGFCRGVASRPGASMTLRTYLLVGGQRGVLTLFATLPSAQDAPREEEQIVASLEP